MKALVHLKKKKCPVKYLACAAKHLVCAVKHLICAMSCFVVPILHPVRPNLTCHVYDRKMSCQIFSMYNVLFCSSYPPPPPP